MKKLSFKLLGMPATATVCVGYLLIGLAWISWSDKALAVLVPDPELNADFQIYKGWFFVFITTLFLYVALKRINRHINRTHAKQVESEERLRLIFEQADDGILLLTEDYRIVDCNPGICRLFGVESKDDLVGRHMKEFSPERQRNGRLSSEIIAEMTRDLMNGELRQFYWCHILPSGAMVDVEVHLKRIRIGDTFYLQSVTRDVSERVRMEKDRRREEARNGVLLELYEKAGKLADKELYDLVLEHAVFLTGSGIGFLHLVSDDQKTLALTTWSSNTLTDCTASCDDHYPLEQAGNWVDCVHLKRPVIYNDYGNSPNQKGLPEGHAPLTRFMSVPVLEQGKIKIILGVGNKRTDYDEQDSIQVQLVAQELHKIMRQRSLLNDLKKAEETAVREKKRLKFIFDALPIGISLNRVHPDGRETRLINDAHLRIAGIRREQDEPKTWLRISHPDDRDQRQAFMNQLEEGKISHFTMDKRYVHPDGRVVWVLFSMQRRKLDDGGFEDLCAVVDITGRKHTEELLFQREQEFRALVENSQYIIARYDRDCRRTYVNPAFFAMAGMPHIELLGNAPEQRSPLAPAEAAALQGVLRRVLESGDPESVDLAMTKGDDTQRWFHIHVVPEHGREGVVESVLLTAHDITERKLAEKEIAKTKQQLQMIIDNTHDAIFQIDLEGNYIYCNAASEDMTGYRSDQLLTMNMMQLIAPEYQPMVAERLRQRIANELNESTFDFEIVRGDGRRVWVEVETKAVRDADGRLAAIQGVARDVTERKRMGEQLRHLYTAINQADEVVVITDAEGNVEYVNPAFETVTGYSREEVVGQNPRLLKSGYHSDAFYQNLWECIVSGKSWVGRFHNKRKDGSIFIEESTVSPVCAPDGTIVSYVAVKRDITKVLQLEEKFLQAQKMEAVGRLASGVAHDFNNILQTILGFCGVLLMETDGRDAIQQDVREIQNAAKQAGDLTRQLLTFSRKQPAMKAQLDLNETVANQISMLCRLLEENVKLMFDPSDALKPLLADRSQIEQVVMNLVVNARDAMPDGGRIDIRTRNVVLAEEDTGSMPKARIGEFVCLSVSDTGTGMDKEVLDHLFEPFFTTKPAGKGTGLGLAVIYGIVDQHGGWIDVGSDPGKGSVFSIYLPANVGNEAMERAGNGEEQHSFRSRGRGKRVLLVEDDPQVRKLSMLILMEAGYAVTDAVDARQAKEVFVRNVTDFDLLLIDAVLPDFSGIHLADALCQEKPGMSVIIFSGYSDERVRIDIIEQKGYYFLRKPFSTEALLRMVHMALKRNKNNC